MNQKPDLEEYVKKGTVSVVSLLTQINIRISGLSQIFAQVCIVLFLSLWMSDGIAGTQQPVCKLEQVSIPGANCDTTVLPRTTKPVDQKKWIDQALQIAQRPFSGGTHHHVENWVSWHGRAMVLAWGFLLPLGVLIARFFKTMPGQNWPTRLNNKTWWHWHRILQYGGVLVMTIGLLIALSGTATKSPWRNTHTVIGWGIFILAWLQILSAHSRGSKGGPSEQFVGRILPKSDWAGDHYDMTNKRVIFEKIHKALGYTILLLSSVTIFLGLGLADAPLWMWIGQLVWTLLYVAAFVWLQRIGRCIDTYQAIWGPDLAHPGNRMIPIGWGIRRYSSSSYANRFLHTPHN